MNDNYQDEIERLKREVERLQKQIEMSAGTQQTRNVANLPSLIDNHDFITDLARYAEGLYSEAAVKKKYRFDDATWVKLGEDEALIEAIEAEKIRRIRNGSAKREKAQQLIVKGPEILDGIMSDPKSNARHKVDAIKTLDALADNGPKSAPDGERIQIIIDLGGGTKFTFGKGIEPNSNDIDPNDGEIIDATPQELLPVIAANKRTTEDGGGEPI